MTNGAPTLFVISTKSNTLVYPNPIIFHSNQKTELRREQENEKTFHQESLDHKNISENSSQSNLNQKNIDIKPHSKNEDENPFFQASDTTLIPLACDNLFIQTSSLLSLLLTLNILNNNSFYLKFEITREKLGAVEMKENKLGLLEKLETFQEINNTNIKSFVYTIVSYNWNDHLYAFIVNNYHPKHSILLRQIISYQQLDLVNKELELDSFLKESKEISILNNNHSASRANQNSTQNYLSFEDDMNFKKSKSTLSNSLNIANINLEGESNNDLMNSLFKYISKYVIIDSFMVRDSSENGSLTIYTEDIERNYDSSQHSISFSSQEHEFLSKSTIPSSTFLPSPLRQTSLFNSHQVSSVKNDTVSFLFDFIDEYTLENHSTNYILHPTSEYFSLILACCRYIMRHKKITRSVIKLLNNVYIGIVWLPIYSSTNSMSQAFMLMLYKKKPNHFDLYPFEKISVPTMELYNFNHVPYSYSLPLVNVTWCIDPNIFTTHQQEEINQYILRLIPKIIKPPAAKSKAPQRRLIIPVSPLDNLKNKLDSPTSTMNFVPQAIKIQNSFPSQIVNDSNSNQVNVNESNHTSSTHSLNNLDNYSTSINSNSINSNSENSKLKLVELSREESTQTTYIGKEKSEDKNTEIEIPIYSNLAPPNPSKNGRNNFRRFRNSPQEKISYQEGTMKFIPTPPLKPS